MVVSTGSLKLEGYGKREELTTEQLKAAAARILLSYKYDKVNGIGCAEVVMKAGNEPSNKKRIQVKNIESGVVFESIKAAADSINMDGSAFVRKLKRKKLKQFEYHDNK